MFLGSSVSLLFFSCMAALLITVSFSKYLGLYRLRLLLAIPGACRTAAREEHTHLAPLRRPLSREWAVGCARKAVISRLEV